MPFAQIWILTFLLLYWFPPKARVPCVLLHLTCRRDLIDVFLEGISDPNNNLQRYRLQLFSQCRNVDSFCLFYNYFHVNCSSEFSWLIFLYGDSSFSLTSFKSRHAPDEILSLRRVERTFVFFCLKNSKFFVKFTFNFSYVFVWKFSEFSFSFFILIFFFSLSTFSKLYFIFCC